MGESRLIAIDGPAGSGKTTLANDLVALLGLSRSQPVVVHTDDLMDGWDGMAGIGGQLRSIVEPIGRGHPGHYRRYDWHTGCFAERVEVPVTPWLIIEGVGAADPAIESSVTVLVWVEADDDLRLARWIARDGAIAEQHHEAWMRQEAEFFAERRTAERADLRFSATPHGAPPIR